MLGIIIFPFFPLIAYLYVLLGPPVPFFHKTVDCYFFIPLFPPPRTIDFTPPGKRSFTG